MHWWRNFDPTPNPDCLQADDIDALVAWPSINTIAVFIPMMTATQKHLIISNGYKYLAFILYSHFEILLAYFVILNNLGSWDFLTVSYGDPLHGDTTSQIVTSSTHPNVPSKGNCLQNLISTVIF